MGAYADKNDRLIERGFAAIPIMPGTKEPGFLHNGRWVGLLKWPQRYSRGVPPEAVRARWGAGDSGLGMLTGAASKGTVGIDIDTDDQAIDAAIRSVLPATPVKKRGAKGETLFYHGPKITASRKWQIDGKTIVELLGPGKQTVLPPTMHPDIGRPYTWTGTETLEDVAPNELPELDVDVADKIDAVLAPFGYEAEPAPAARGDGAGNGAADDDSPHRQLNNMALANLTAWVPALNLYRCRAVPGGYEAVPSWRPSTTGREPEKRHRNLKIVPGGIRDFGRGQGYTPLDLVMAARGCDLDGAWQFLSDQLGFIDDLTIDFKEAEAMGSATPESASEPTDVSSGRAEKQQSDWPEPDLGVLRLQRRDAPRFPIEIFHDDWARWIEDTAEGSSCPVDYVAAPLLAAASTLIGHARWAQASRRWTEPPHLWCASIGDSGDGKSPGADPITKYVLPVIESKMTADFPDQLREVQAAIEIARAKHESWKADVRKAIKEGKAPPLPPPPVPEEPVSPRLVLSDITIEKVAALLAYAAPKGVLMYRDELAGWLLGMSAYNDSARPFWLESYGGRPYRQDRVKHPVPISIPRFAVSWHGGIVPARLAEIMRGADDGLLARFMFFWPEPVPFHIIDDPPKVDWAVACFDRLRMLDLTAGDRGPEPLMVPLTGSAVRHLERFGQLLQEEKEGAAGLMRSAIGKGRGLALRVSHVLEHLYWCAKDGYEAAPKVTEERTLLDAARFVSEYVLPMAERAYGDAACTEVDRNTATLARWIKKVRLDEIHVREMQRTIRLPGLTTSEAIHTACRKLIEAGWLGQPERGGFQQKPRAIYPLSPRLKEILL